MTPLQDKNLTIIMVYDFVCWMTLAPFSVTGNSWCFPSQSLSGVTQTILLRARKCISFSKWQVRSVVILSEERWALKCLFEPRGLIKKKKGEEMTLFSLHHNSNFLGLVPPALWRDPGHCAGGRRGKTERITHPGKTDVQCGVLVFSLTHTHTLIFTL